MASQATKDAMFAQLVFERLEDALKGLQEGAREIGRLEEKGEKEEQQGIAGNKWYSPEYSEAQLQAQASRSRITEMFRQLFLDA